MESATGNGAMWKAHLFGQFRIEPLGGGQTITRFESRRAAALLAFLILHDQQSHSREVLADRIWPEVDPATARNRLKQALSSLRKQLEPPGYPSGCVFAADRISIGLVPGAITSDYQELLRHLSMGNRQAAAEIGYSGLLPELYDEWLDDLRLWVEGQGFESAPVQEGESDSILVVAENTFIKRIPAAPTPFVGRETEVNEILEALKSTRLITATGFGGIGKTRLTMEVGKKWADGKVLFIALAEASSAQQGLARLSDALGIAIKRSDKMLAEICGAIGHEPNLLILDNLEQLVGIPWAGAISQLLEECSELKILASSRIPLGVQGERHFQVHPLPVPSSTDSIEAISGHAATQLFIDRARRTRADFQITERNLGAMRELLGALAGVPLALELCAAWAHVITPSQMVERLSASGEMLTSRRKDVPDRQRSLHDAFATTISLLTADQRKLLTQLSVFRGGCTLELAQLVFGEQIALSDLSDLLDAALLRRSETENGSRYWMLESLREFVQTDEAAGPMLPELQARLLKVLAQLAVDGRSLRVRPELGIQTELDWIGFMDGEWQNFTEAIQQGIRTGALEDAGVILRHTDWHWVMRGRDAIILPWLTETLAANESGKFNALTEDTQLVLSAIAGFQSRHLTDLRKAEQLLKYLGEIARDRASIFARAEVLYNLAQAKVLRLEPDGLFEIAEEASGLFIESGHPWRAAMCQRMMGIICIELKELDRTERYFDLSDEIFIQENRGYMRALLNYDRSRVTFDRGDYKATVTILKDIRVEAEKYGDPKLLARTGNLRGLAERQLGLFEDAAKSLGDAWRGYVRIREFTSAGYPLWNLSTLLCGRGELIAGIQLLSAAAKLWVSTTGNELDEEDLGAINQHYSAAVERLGTELTEYLWNQGRAMTYDQITEFIERNT